MPPRIIVSAVVAVIGLGAPVQALQLRVYSAASHDRFTNFPSSPSPNLSFIHAGLDLSGVGYNSVDSRKQFTLISPKFFVSANHFRPLLGSSVHFVTASGTLVTRTVAALHTIPNDDGDATDLMLGELSAPVDPSSGIQFLPYLNLATESAYSGQSLVVLGKSARGGQGISESSRILALTLSPAEPASTRRASSNRPTTRPPAEPMMPLSRSAILEARRS